MARSRSAVKEGSLTMALLVGLVSVAGASHGGPALTELIGFDTTAGRLYYVVRSHSESWDYPQILFLQVGSAKPSLPVQYPVATPSHPKLDEGHAAVERVVDSLRIACASPIMLDKSTFALVADTLAERYFSDTDFDYKRKLFVIRATVSGALHSGATVLSVFCNGGVHLTEMVRFAGPDWVVAKLRYAGIPIETCYERDELVVLRPVGK